MAVESNESSFEVRVDGEVTGEIWTGTFMAKKRLSHRDQLKKDLVRRELLGGAVGPATERANSTAMILSELAVRITKAPKWWTAMGDGLDFQDDNVISAVYDAAMAVERDAAEAHKKKAEKAIEEMRAEAATKAAAEAEEK